MAGAGPARRPPTVASLMTLASSAAGSARRSGRPWVVGVLEGEDLQVVTLDLDYTKIGKILKDVGFQGYVSIEFEGKADAHVGVPQSVEMLRNALPK